MAIDIFLKLDGIDGESVDKAHKGEIEVLSYNWGLAQRDRPAPAEEAEPARRSFDELRFVARLQKSSPKLFAACASGQAREVGRALGRARPGAKPFEFLKITLTDMLVSSFEHLAPGEESGGALEEVGLRFAKIKMEYTEQSKTGAAGTVTSAEWDLKTGKGG